MNDKPNAAGLVLWFQDGINREDDKGDRVFVPFTKWHVQKTHDDQAHRRRAVCGYELNEGFGRTDLFADIDAHFGESDDDVCKVCGRAVKKQDDADIAAMLAADDVDA